MLGKVFQKTDLGKAEVACRQAGLSRATRSVLIMINGSDSVGALVARGVEQVQSHFDALLTLRLIEPVSEPRTRLRPTDELPGAATRSTEALTAPSEPDLEPLRRRAMVQLMPHFGPDTAVMAEALLAARTAASFNQALDVIQAQLAIYLGRKQAQIELQTLRP
ncbi:MULTISPECIES: hypothetical protein [Comamonadaceae]|jgi:hypothetical protein|uniref:Uncharacterized protein n=1 Tax=Acidovorax facilis TaxID=12917 RepID=A0ABV8D6S9_9BURK|nr:MULTISPECIES: hypothetical protein [Comamonadaceae]KQB60763.1 hypothetical protein AE621_03870 [Acidovorax sp. SD340]MBO1008217.1 hypothetical protein [Acidovorax sp. SD340]MCO4242369.1 hypothetical protein [Acidovorax facilis]MDZ4283026.1 hypothetical protein [Hydrogenophaga sp.]